MEDEGLEMKYGESQYSLQKNLSELYGRASNREEKKEIIRGSLGLTPKQTRQKALWELEQEWLQAKGLLRTDPSQIPFK